jgi:hypothetical protein
VTLYHIQKAREALNEAIKLDDQRHQENIENMAFNTAQYDALIRFMDSIGIKKTYSTRDLKSRARYPKYINKTAGYIEDVQRVAAMTDGYDHSVYRRKQLLTYLDNEEKKIEEANKSREREETSKKLKREADLAIARIIIKYNLPDDSDWDEIEEHLTQKDKYLGLAANMLAVRGDWNEGCDSVEYALGRFPVETVEDQEIFDNVTKAVDIFHEDPDGRVFRDIEYNYSVLFTKVDPEILADYEVIRKYNT